MMRVTIGNPAGRGLWLAALALLLALLPLRTGHGEADAYDPWAPEFHQLRPLPGSPDQWLDLLPPAPVTAQNVFPPDMRREPKDTTKAPFDGVAYLVMADESGVVGQCSGSMLASNVVLTAAHCLYDGKYVKAVGVAPGANVDAAPYGIGTSTQFVVPKGWATSQDETYDFGLVFLKPNAFPLLAPPFFVPTAGSESFFNLTPGVVLHTAGYHGDKPDGSMWEESTDNFGATDTLIGSYLAGEPGQSGSPLWVEVPGGVRQLGVFTESSPFFNIGVRFTADHLAALQKFCADAKNCSFETATIGDDRPVPAPPTGPLPAAYAGNVKGIKAGGFVIAVVIDGQTATACGTGRVSTSGSDVQYGVLVLTDAARAGCGKVGRKVRLYFSRTGDSSSFVSEDMAWNSSPRGPQNLTLSGGLRSRLTTAAVASDP